MGFVPKPNHNLSTVLIELKLKLKPMKSSNTKKCKISTFLWFAQRYIVTIYSGNWVVRWSQHFLNPNSSKVVLVAITQTHCHCFCMGPVGSLGYKFGHLPRIARVRADPCVDFSVQPTICDCHKKRWQDIHFVHFTYSISHPFLVVLFLLRSTCIHCFYFFQTFSHYSAKHSQHSSSSYCQKFGIMFSTVHLHMSAYPRSQRSLMRMHVHVQVRSCLHPSWYMIKA